jgi:hypothetical protein
VLADIGGIENIGIGLFSKPNRASTKQILSYAAFKLKIKHPMHDYSLISSNLRTPSLASRRAGADHHFISSLLEGSLDFPELISFISFHVPFHSTRNHSVFQLPYHRISYGFNHLLHRIIRNLNSA